MRVTHARHDSASSLHNKANMSILFGNLDNRIPWHGLESSRWRRRDGNPREERALWYTATEDTRVGYKQPILIEIFAELHLAEASLAPAQYFDIVPLLREVGLPEVELGQVEALAVNPGPGLPALARLTAPRVRCWSPERTKLVQLSPDMVVINQVGKYLGWPAFEELFGTVRDILQRRLGHLQPASISLNTIDSMSPPRDGFTLGKYLNCGGEFVPRWYHDTSVTADITLGRGLLRDDGSNRQIRIAVRVDDTQAQVQMNCVFHDALAEQESVDAKLARLHEESTRTFEGTITEATRALMGGRA